MLSPLEHHSVAVGLGNPGPEYEQSRHNAGFRVMDRLWTEHKGTTWKKISRGLESQVRLKNKYLKLFKPMTYMNLSGEAVFDYLKMKNLNADEMIIVYDDLDINPGQIRVKFGGGDGGHNGLKSIIGKLNTDRFTRVRIGIGKPLTSLGTVDFVLNAPEGDEKEKVNFGVTEAVRAVKTVILESRKSAMNRFNRRNEVYSEE